MGRRPSLYVFSLILRSKILRGRTYECLFTCNLQQYQHDTSSTLHDDGIEYRELCVWLCVGGSKEPTKTTHAKMGLAKRGLGAKRAQANSVSDDDGTGVRVGRGDQVCGVCMCARVQACGAAHPLVASVTELMVGLCKRESNQPRPGVAPGCPQPMLRAQPCVCGAERVRQGCRHAQVDLYGEAKTPAK